MRKIVVTVVAVLALSGCAQAPAEPETDTSLNCGEMAELIAADAEIYSAPVLVQVSEMWLAVCGPHAPAEHVDEIRRATRELKQQLP